MLLELDCRRTRGEFTLALELRAELSGALGLFGPSGSGKTSLLRLLAGLDRADTGSIRYAGASWQDSARGQFLAPHKRRVGFVFQDSRLFSHLDVQGNLDYPRRRCRGPIRFEDVLAALDLAPLLRRRPDSLSGGERQRVAIGRALLSQPALMLLDEPLSALDAGRKAEILPYLQRLPEAFAVPLLYVSHDLEEIAALAPRVLLLDAGRLQGEADPAALLARLARRAPADPDSVPALPAAHPASEPAPPSTDGALSFRVSASDVLLALTPPAPGEHALILAARFAGWLVSEDAKHSRVARLVLEDGQTLLSEVPDAAAPLALRPGQQVWAQVAQLGNR